MAVLYLCVSAADFIKATGAMAVIGMLLHIIAAGATIYFVFNKKTKNAINVAIFAGLIAGKFNVIFLNRFGKPLLFTLHYSSHPFPLSVLVSNHNFFSGL